LTRDANDFVTISLRFFYSVADYAPLAVSRTAKPVELAGADAAVRVKLNAYIGYEHAKGLRQSLTKRFVVFVLGVGILSLGLHLLPTAALLTTVLMALGLLVVAGTNERKARQRLTEQLNRRQNN